MILASIIISFFLAFAIVVGSTAFVHTRSSETIVVLKLLRTKPIPAICRSIAAAICAHGSIA